MIFTFPMYGQVAQYEGKGGFMVFSDGEGEYHPEADRAAFSGGGILVEVPQAGQQLESYSSWAERETNALYAGQQAQRQAGFDKLCEGTYNVPPEPVRMVPGLNPVTGHFDTRPEREDEKAARLVRDEGDAAIRAGHITHDELTPDEVSELAPSEYRAWREKNPDR